MKKKLNIFALIAIAFAGVSCSFLDVKPDAITGDTFYKTESDFYYGLVGVYGSLNNEAFYGNYYSLMLSNTDDLSYYNRTSTSNNSVWYTHDAGSAEIFEAWTEIYRGINNANVLMKAYETSDLDLADEKAYYNEARFLRAYYHFILAQAWGDVPLRTIAIQTQEDETNCPATPQLEILQWVTDEMKAVLYDGMAAQPDEEFTEPTEESLAAYLAKTDLSNAPSRITNTTIAGILARVYLFMAGESIEDTTPDMKTEYFAEAGKFSKAAIDCGLHRLYGEGNPAMNGYAQMFINMISDVYDTEYRESMWEADFYGNRSSSNHWSNGRIGDLIGLQSSADVGTYDIVNCNFAYGQYNGSLKLWELYWETDRVDAENRLARNESVTDPESPDYEAPSDFAGNEFWEENVGMKKGWDKRQFWNLCPYNYAGGNMTASGVTTTWLGGIDRTPYRVSTNTTEVRPTIAQGVRNCGKYRREVQYEGVKGDRGSYTPVNYPVLRFADVLLMYAEASNEVDGPTQDAYDCVKRVRDRAGIQTRAFSEYGDKEAFRQLIRNERGRELCFESLRKYDLIRWGIFVEAMHDYIEDELDPDWGSGNTASRAAETARNVQNRHILLPIPSIELGVNGALRQNSLW